MSVGVFERSVHFKKKHKKTLNFNHDLRVGILITETELFCEWKWLQNILLSRNDQ